MAHSNRQSLWSSVIFIDLDATILRGPFESAVFPVVFKELADKSGLDVHEVRRRVIQERVDRQKRPGVPATLVVDWDDIFKTVAGRLGLVIEARALTIVHSHAAPPYSGLLDDADQVLRELKNPDRVLVVATQGLRKYQLPVLDALHLTPLFDDILTPDSYQALKQNIAFYGSWPERARLRISVGDQYSDDVAAPHSFGFKTIWRLTSPDSRLAQCEPFDRPAAFSYSPDQTARPDAIILSLHELPYVVSRLEAQDSSGS